MAGVVAKAPSASALATTVERQTEENPALENLALIEISCGEKGKTA